MLFRLEVSAVHFYIDGLGRFGCFECLNYLFLDGYHTSHYLCKTICQLVGFLSGYDNLSLAFLP